MLVAHQLVTIDKQGDVFKAYHLITYSQDHFKYLMIVYKPVPPFFC